MGLPIIYFWPRSLLEAPKRVKDPGNGLKSIRGSWRDHFGGISGVLDTFRGLKKAPRPKIYKSEVHSRPYFDVL